MDDNEFSFIKSLIGDTHDEEAPAPVQEMPPSHTPRYSARHKKSFLSFLKKGPQKAARKRLPPQIVSIYFGVPGSGKTTYGDTEINTDNLRRQTLPSSVLRAFLEKR